MRRLLRLLPTGGVVVLAMLSFAAGAGWEAHHLSAAPAASRPPSQQVLECVGHQARQFAPPTYICGWVTLPPSP
jgi:hypothetical protein